VPSRKKPVERVKVVLAYGEADNPWVKVFFDQVRFAGGAAGRYNRIVEGGGRTGVAVLPLWRGSIGLLRHYRYPVDAWMLEIPRGFGESRRSKVEALRELREETGLVPDRVVDLGRLHSNSGLLAGTIRLFAALFDSPPRQLQATDGEASGLAWFAWDELAGLVAADRITDALTLAAVTKAMVAGLLELRESPKPRRGRHP
jgi:ADP-ribose pyrophosphatase